MRINLFVKTAIIAVLASAALDPLSAEGAQPMKAATDASEKTDVSGAVAAGAAVIKKTEISNFDFWHLQCDLYADVKLGRKCAARLPVFKQNSQDLLAVLVIAQDDAKKWVLRVVIPTSISVVDGGSIGFDGDKSKPQNFPIETCEPAACASSMPIDDAMLQTLKDSSKVTLSWTAMDHTPVKFDFEIKGIQQTLKAMFG